MTKVFDVRLLYVFFLGLSGAVLLFTFVLSVSILEAAIATTIGLAITVLIARRNLPPWRGTERERLLVVGFGAVQLAIVIVVAAVVR
jgi:hypothetical protein